MPAKNQVRNQSQNAQLHCPLSHGHLNKNEHPRLHWYLSSVEKNLVRPP